MKLYKVLNEDMTSPFRRFHFELGKKYVCEYFDDSDTECSRGFYATDFNGLGYSINNNGKKHPVFEVEVGGKSREFNQFKRRYEEITVLRQLSEEEIKAGLMACAEQEGYNTLEACYPVNPFDIEPVALDGALILLEQWKKVMTSACISVGDSVWDSVVTSVWASVRASIGDSVWDSVWSSVGASVGTSLWDLAWSSLGDSVGDSISAYISSLFPTIKKWKYVDHAEGENPFQSGIDLWRGGYVPSFDGRTWRLHTRDGIAWEEK